MNSLNIFIPQEISTLPDDEHPDIDYAEYGDILSVLHVNLKSEDRPLMRAIGKDIRSKFFESIMSIITGELRPAIQQLGGIPILGTGTIDYENLKPQPNDPEISENRDFLGNEGKRGEVSMSLAIGSKIGSDNIVDDMRGLLLTISIPKIRNEHERKIMLQTVDNFQLNNRYKLLIWKLIYNVFYYNFCQVTTKYLSDGLLTIPFGNGDIQIDIMKHIFALLNLNRTVPDNFGNQNQDLIIGGGGSYLLTSQLWGDIDEDGHLLNRSSSYQHSDAGFIIRNIINNYVRSL